MKSIKVRFNLSRGVNYLKWKIEYPDGNVMYYHPTGVQLVMGECTLKNYKKTAEKIHNGANKSVCAWVLCKTLDLKFDNFITDNTTQIKYNQVGYTVSRVMKPPKELGDEYQSHWGNMVEGRFPGSIDTHHVSLAPPHPIQHPPSLSGLKSS